MFQNKQKEEGVKKSRKQDGQVDGEGEREGRKKGGKERSPKVGEDLLSMTT